MVTDFITRRPTWVGYGLIATVWLIAITAWAQTTPNAFNGPSAYDIFPLLGLLAFSALLSAYVINALENYLKIPRQELSSYYRIAGYAILVLILLHPAVLVSQLYLDGFGLPPASYGSYVSERYLWVVSLGMLSLLIFLAYELHRWFSKKGWWKWIIYANDVAMLLIFFHGMTLGSELQTGWFRYVWWFYGVVIVTVIVYLRFFARKKPHPTTTRTS